MEEIKLRKYEHALVISGVGVIAFGLWSVVKAVIYFILLPMKQLKAAAMGQDLVDVQLQATDRETAFLLAAAIIFVLVLDFAMRLYIGRSAFIDGRRLKKKRFAYVIMAMFVAAGLVSNLVTRYMQMGSGKETAWESVVASANVSVVVDITSLLALIEMIVAAIMVRRLRKRLGISETGVM